MSPDCYWLNRLAVHWSPAEQEGCWRLPGWPVDQKLLVFGERHGRRCECDCRCKVQFVDYIINELGNLVDPNVRDSVSPRCLWGPQWPPDPVPWLVGVGLSSISTAAVNSAQERFGTLSHFSAVCTEILPHFLVCLFYLTIGLGMIAWGYAYP